MKKEFDTTGKLVKVVFADPAEYDSRFDEDFEPVKCCAIGWLVKKTRKTLRLAWLQDEIDGASGGIAIPAGSIISVKSIGKMGNLRRSKN
jgi:hypothetical protein